MRSARPVQWRKEGCLGGGQASVSEGGPEGRVALLWREGTRGGLGVVGREAGGAGGASAS